jgi:hypothetical protein
MNCWALRGLVCAACVFVGVSGAPAATMVGSTFDAGADGWQVMDCGNTPPWSAIGTFAVNWQASGGDPGAFIYRVDPTSNTYFFDAPSKFLGNKSAYVGEMLTFSLLTTIDDYNKADVVVLRGAGLAIVAPHGGIPSTGAWHPFSIPLVHTTFRYNSPEGATVTEADFAAVLADLDSLRISAEYGDQAGEETTSLDSVCLTPDPATVSLLLAGGVGLLARRRQKPSA